MKKKETLTQIFKKKGITRRSDKIEFIRNNNLVTLKSVSGGFPAGTKIDSDNARWEYSDSSRVLVQIEGRGSTFFYCSEMTCEGWDKLSKEDAEAQIKEIDKQMEKLNAEKAEAQNVITMLNKAGVDSFTDTEHKVYMTLQTIDKENMTDVEKAQAIAKLIDG
jgi:Mg2+ and Co2+ transporter CorA